MQNLVANSTNNGSAVDSQKRDYRRLLWRCECGIEKPMSASALVSGKLRVEGGNPARIAAKTPATR
jgi:hypothetical protein